MVVALAILSGAVLLLAASVEVRLSAVGVWGLAPLFALLCWRIERVGAEVQLSHGFWWTACLLPGVLLAIRVLPTNGPADPSVWMLSSSPSGYQFLAGAHLLGTASPTVALGLAAMRGAQARRARRLRLCFAAAIGGGGLAWAGFGLMTDPELVRVGFASATPIVAVLVTGSVVTSTLWATSTEASSRAATAVSMTRIVSNTTVRLGRELALAHAHARSLADALELSERSALEGLLSTLERGQDLAGALSRNADGEAHNRVVIGIDDLTSRVLLYASNGRRDVATVTHATSSARVWMNASTLERAVLALVRNALQAQSAIGAKTTIAVRTFTTTQVHLASAVIAGQLDHQQYVVVEVVDEGDGLDAPTRARCLEPFYSTRDGHDGLGLFAVLTLVRTEEAAFELSTTHGLTRAALWLPLHKQAMEESTDTWTWKQLGMVNDQREVIVVDQDGRRLEKFGLLLTARGLRWAGVEDLQSLVSGQVGPCTDGVVLVMDELSGRDLTLLARWMAPRLAYVVARPATIAGLIARGMSAEEALAFQSDRAHAVMSAIESALIG